MQAVIWETTHQWSGTDTTIVRVLFVLGYVLDAAYIAFSILLMCCNSAFAHPNEPSTPMLDDTYAQEHMQRVRVD